MLAKTAVIVQLEHGKQTSRQVHKSTGIKLSTVQGTISRLIHLGAVVASYVEHEGLRCGPREKAYTVVRS